MKKSTIVRVPDELLERLKQYEKTLPVKMDRMNLMRNFANDAITPFEDLDAAVKRLGNASRKKFK